MFFITEDQKRRLRELSVNVEKMEDINTFLARLDQEILSALGKNYAPTNRSDALQDIYDEVYNQNPD